jgi:hypothetical protein
MANSDCTFQQYFETLFEKCWEQSGKNTNEIFGAKETLPEDELEFVFSAAFRKLSQADKVKALRDHRARTIEGWN